MKGSPLDNRGFTLIEIMVASTCMAILVLGIITTYSSSHLLVVKTRLRRKAIHLAQKHLEEWMAKIEGGGPLSQIYSSQISIDEQRSINGELKIIPNPQDKSIQCHIIWEDGNVSLATIWGK